MPTRSCSNSSGNCGRNASPGSRLFYSSYRLSYSSSQYPSTSMDLTKFHNSAHAHDDTQGLSRVIMTRKMEQRIFVNSSRNGRREPQVETLTKETIETFRAGNRTERKITTSQKKDTPKNTRDSGEFLTLSRSASSSPELISSIKRGTLKKSPINKKNDVDVDKFTEQCLRAHNEHRSKHKVPPLTINKKLCKYSQEWAQHLVVRGVLDRRQNCPYGENLFCSWSCIPNYSVDGSECVDNWYNEIHRHCFGKEPSTLKSGHFTQVVWFSSKELGVGIARSRNGQVFVVVNYDPPGNFLGQFKENVPPIGGFVDFVLSSEYLNEYTYEQFLSEGLKIHNDYRKKHRVAALVLSDELCKLAQDWSEILAKEEKLSHRPDCPFGENLFCMWSSNTITARDACFAWYQEGKDYNYALEPKLLRCPHFTQMIWKSAKQLGLGKAKGRSGRLVIVANYSPAGNVLGQFMDNIFPPSV